MKDRDNAEQIVTPAVSYKSAATIRKADLTLDTDGSVQGTVQFTITGPQALYWRQNSIRNQGEDFKKELQKSMQEILPEGLQTDLDHYSDVTAYNAPFVVNLKVSGSVGTVTGKHMFLPSQFFESHIKHPFVAEEKRVAPIDVHYCRIDQDTTTWHLPDDYIVESAPAVSNMTWQDHALMKISSSSSAGTVQIQRVSAYNYVFVNAADYGELRGFYLKQAAADQQQLVLVKAPRIKEK